MKKESEEGGSNKEKIPTLRSLVGGAWFTLVLGPIGYFILLTPVRFLPGCLLGCHLGYFFQQRGVPRDHDQLRVPPAPRPRSRPTGLTSSSPIAMFCILLACSAAGVAWEIFRGGKGESQRRSDLDLDQHQVVAIAPLVLGLIFGFASAPGHALPGLLKETLSARRVSGWGSMPSSSA